MSIFRAKSKKTQKEFEKKRLIVLQREPNPASEICKHCWYQATCLFRTIRGDKPHTCCVYSLFTSGQQKSFTLEEVVTYTCETKCVERQSWIGDPVPHDTSYCEQHCPVSKFIRNEKASDPNDVPKNGNF